ncbi:PREDICTED: uncharacterized protein KIAA1109-like, partial [Priapulus caudatus]|uniref:Uncharacterized protein KIAA1109-like n=1 Tax=Priapulus caudatus TaxID=37621 RepID=A0ABM1EX09_PRICU
EAELSQADPEEIFQPLLICLGLTFTDTHPTTVLLAKLGPNVSILAQLECIQEAELSQADPEEIFQPLLICLGLTFTDTHPTTVLLAKLGPNVSILAQLECIQVLNMIENINETRSELRENRAVATATGDAHIPSTSGTDTQSQPGSARPPATPTGSQSSEQLDAFHPAGGAAAGKSESRARQSPKISKGGGSKLPAESPSKSILRHEFAKRGSQPGKYKLLIDDDTEGEQNEDSVNKYQILREDEEAATTTSRSTASQKGGLMETRIDMEEVTTSEGTRQDTDALPLPPVERAPLRPAVFETIPVVVFGTVKLKHMRILATLSGLKLDAKVDNIHASVTHKLRLKGMPGKKVKESSLSAFIGNTLIVLLEGVLPSQQTVVSVRLARSDLVASSLCRRGGRETNHATASLGALTFDIPHHPVILHSMMTRGSKQLSTTLREVKETDEDSVDGSPKHKHPHKLVAQRPITTQRSPKPLVVHFSIVLESLTIGASLLPSLRAQYMMGKTTSTGMTGSKGIFVVDLPAHRLCFVSKVSAPDTNIPPPSADVVLPPVLLSADYRVPEPGVTAAEQSTLAEGMVLREGNYVNAVAKIGAFQHSLTTDLLNHLMFVQKVFMKEINEVVQKVSGGDQPVAVWSDFSRLSSKPDASKPKHLLYSMQFRLQGIQITATTPTSTAVRLETGEVVMDLSNRLQSSAASRQCSNPLVKLFGKLQVYIEVTLGQLLKDVCYEEKEPDFVAYAFFKTKVGLRNALQDEMMSNQSEDKEAVLITLTRPIIYAQPIATDKAILVWLNFKNAYDYWNQERQALNKEVQTATQQLIEMLPPIWEPPPTNQAVGTLFIQVTLQDMGICLPLTSSNQGIYQGGSRRVEWDPTSAMVLTLESSRISACSRTSLVSKGKFKGFCLRFADDFEVTWDDWKPDPNEVHMNLCVVPEGTYEVCSKTVQSDPKDAASNAKWILSLHWQMQGIDVQLDTNIGRCLALLTKTMTMMAAGDDDADNMAADADILSMTSDDSDMEPAPAPMMRRQTMRSDAPPPAADDGKVDGRRSCLEELEEVNQQAQFLNYLVQHGARENTIEETSARAAGAGGRRLGSTSSAATSSTAFAARAPAPCPSRTRIQDNSVSRRPHSVDVPILTRESSGDADGVK